MTTLTETRKISARMRTAPASLDSAGDACVRARASPARRTAAAT